MAKFIRWLGIFETLQESLYSVSHDLANEGLSDPLRYI